MKKQELLAHSLKRQSNIKFFADQTQCNGDGFTVTIQKGKITSVNVKKRVFQHCQQLYCTCISSQFNLLL